MLWGLGVGYVISGEYFGWNLGLPLGGTFGMLAATLVITVMYLTFSLSYAELACAMPQAGGAFVYGERAFGAAGGRVAGIAQFVEFVFAPPAIAMAIAAYVGQRFSGLDVRLVAMAAYLVFTALNAWGVKQAAVFEFVVTVLAVAELLVFAVVVAPRFEWANVTANALPNGWSGAFACLPYAIWFYLAIEGVANVAEEAIDPQRNIVLGFGSAIATLVVLALGVFFLSVGVGGWEAVVYAPGSSTPSDAPLPLALAQVVDKGHWLYTVLLGVGLLGLVASFHGIILAAGRATLELGRAGRLPRRLGRIHPKTQTPIWALVVNLLLGVVAIWSGKTGEIITLSCFGALTLYVVSMAALLRLRRTEPQLDRPFRAPFYPWFPMLALGIAATAWVAVFVYNAAIGGVFIGLMAAAYALEWLADQRTRAL